MTADVLRDARILVLHMVRADLQPSVGTSRGTLSLPVTPPYSPSHQGRDFSFDDCGRAFTCLPAEEPGAAAEALVCNLDSLLGTMTHRVRAAWAWDSQQHGNTGGFLGSLPAVPGHAVLLLAALCGLPAWRLGLQHRHAPHRALSTG